MNKSETEFIEAGWRSDLKPMPTRMELDRLIALGKRERSQYVAGELARFFNALQRAVAQVRSTAADCTAARRQAA